MFEPPDGIFGEGRATPIQFWQDVLRPLSSDVPVSRSWQSSRGKWQPDDLTSATAPFGSGRSRGQTELDFWLSPMETIPSDLFHVTEQRLDVGELIRPGRWGRMIKTMGPKHQAWNREMYLEHIRQNEFPSKPSRLNATFSCFNRVAIDHYREHHCPRGILYEVTIADQSGAIHVGDFNAVEPLPRRPETMEQIARKYWTFKLRTNVLGFPGGECLEVLSASPLIVSKIIEK